jgi:Putative beta-barrel porin-2, OmpL-like. bbp2/Carboxypeptidase regulatory-like domain
MITRLLVTVALPACIALNIVPAYAQLVVSGIHGVTLRPDGVPLPEAQVLIHNQNDNTDQSVVSGPDGVFAAVNLKPGQYTLIASKEGFLTSSAAVQLKAHENLRMALALSARDTVAATAPRQAGPVPAERLVPTAASTEAKTLESMQERIERLEAMQQRIEQLEANLKREEAKVDAALTASRLPPTIPATAGAAQPADQHTAAPGLPLYASLATPSFPVTPVNAPSPLALPGPAAPQAGAPPSHQAAPPAAPSAPTIPEALQAPDPAPAVDNFTPFAFGDFTWLNGTPRNKDTVLDTKFFTPEVRFDTDFMEDFNQPVDHTIVGATESFRSGEIQVEQISVGGDFHWQNVRGRILTMDGLFATTTPRNDASAGVGQWDLRDAYKYVSEAYGGYHFNVNHGLNVDAGIFVSYIGLFSYYNFDNWTYQPSYVSSNTPWFFNGMRIQWFPTNKLKIEPWLINGWQSYARYNGHLGLGGQLLWEPKEWFKLVANQYGFGQDNLGLPRTERIHTDDSILVRYYNKPESLGLDKMAFSLTGDLGCQYGGGIQCTGAPSKNKSSFVGWMLYDRMWFHKDLFGLTLGGGEMSNWGRYLTLLPPIDGADAVSGTPYFTEGPGQRAHMWDSTVTFQYMPRQYITWWAEVGYRHSDVPYFAGRGGVTPPGGNNGDPQYYTCMSGATAGTASLAGAEAACGGGQSSVWFPDLRRSEAKVSVGVMVKF